MKKFINWVSIAACLAIVGAVTPATAQENVPVFDRLPLFGEPAAAEELPTPPSKPQIAAVPQRDALISTSVESDGFEPRVAAATRPNESPSLEKRSDRQRPSAAELRQARAMYSMKNRMARIERDAWRGREPLRPNFHGIPNAASIFYQQPRYVVPIYYFGR